jgi:hypothetical protein
MDFQNYSYLDMNLLTCQLIGLHDHASLELLT